MAPSPTIPTSFVPKQPVRSAVRRPSGGTSLFTYVAFGLMIISLLAAGAVFGYKTYLEHVRDADAAKIEEARGGVDGAVVADFIRVRDRFAAARDLLDRHVVFSQFLNRLESLTLQNVRFHSLNYAQEADGTLSIEMTGAARSFNALANESNVFSSVQDMKRVIFSGITAAGKDNSVTFSLSAELEPSLILAKTHVGPAPLPQLPQGQGVATNTPINVPAGTSTPPAPAAQKPATSTPAQKPATTTP